MKLSKTKQTVSQIVSGIYNAYWKVVVAGLKNVISQNPADQAAANQQQGAGGEQALDTQAAAVGPAPGTEQAATPAAGAAPAGGEALPQVQ